MQASKIIPGRVYAVRRNKDTLVRFHVSEVNTITKRRGENRSPHDSRSEIVGFFIEAEDNRRQATLQPDDIAGEFKEFTELVERKAAEDAERKAKSDADIKRSHIDRLALYEFVGVTSPAKHDDYGQLFRANYGKVDISNDGTRAIIDRVHALQGRKANLSVV